LINIKYPIIETHPYSLKDFKDNEFVNEILKDKITPTLAAEKLLKNFKS
jgi:hypothetical protein